MNATEEFTARVGRLEARYKRDKYADAWLMPRDLMIRLRDELKEKDMADTAKATATKLAMSPRDIMRGFQSKTCICGKRKGSRMSHCQKCYYSLPPEQRKALYRKFNDGYEEVFLTSLETLEVTQEEIDKYCQGLAVLFSV